MANRTKLTAKKREQFLAMLAEGGSVTKAARAIGMARQYMYAVRDEEPEFAVAWESAWAEGGDVLEDEAVSRAVDGQVTIKRYYDVRTGNLIREEETCEKSDTLLIFLLKGRKPDTYRERSETTVNGALQVTREYVGIDPHGPESD